MDRTRCDFAFVVVLIICLLLSCCSSSSYTADAFKLVDVTIPTSGHAIQPSLSSSVQPRAVYLSMCFIFTKPPRNPVPSSHPSNATTIKLLGSNPYRFRINTNRTWQITSTFSVTEVNVRARFVVEHISASERNVINGFGKLLVNFSGLHPNDALDKCPGSRAVTVQFEKLSFLQYGLALRTFADSQAYAKSVGGFLATALKTNEQTMLNSYFNSTISIMYWMGSVMIDPRGFVPGLQGTNYCWSEDPDYDESQCVFNQSSPQSGYYSYVRMSCGGISACTNFNVSCARPNGFACPHVAATNFDFDAQTPTPSDPLRFSGRIYYSGIWGVWDRVIDGSFTMAQLITNFSAPYPSPPTYYALDGVSVFAPSSATHSDSVSEDRSASAISGSETADKSASHSLTQTQTSSWPRSLTAHESLSLDRTRTATEIPVPTTTTTTTITPTTTTTTPLLTSTATTATTTVFTTTTGTVTVSSTATSSSTTTTTPTTTASSTTSTTTITATTTTTTPRPPRTRTRTATLIPPTTPAPVISPVPQAAAIIESVGGISAIAAVASAPSIIRGLTVLSMVSDSCNSTPTLSNNNKVKSLPFPQTAAPFLWIGSRDDPRSPHRGAIVANIVIAPVVVMLLSISIWACFFAFQRYMFNRAQKQMLDGGNLPQQKQQSEANSVKQQLMHGVGDPLQPPPEFTLKQLCASSAVLGRVVQCYGFTIEGAMASAMFLWSFNTSPLAGEHSAPDAGDVVLAIFGAFMPIIVLVGLFWYMHSRVLSPKERPENAAVYEAAKMEIKGEFRESRFWRIALGYSTWRPPPEGTAERFNYELCYPMFGKQRGVLPEHKGSRLQTWLAEASARSMINDILITGFLGACRGYALSDPCTRSEGALIFVLILALISLGETILLRSFGSPLRNLIDNLSAFALFAATGMAVSDKTRFITPVAVSTVVLGILSVFLNRGLAVVARLCFQIRLIPASLANTTSRRGNGNELVQLLNEAIFSSAPTRGVEVAPPAPVEVYVPPVVEPPPPPAPRAFEVTPVEQEMNVEMDDFGFLDLENDMNNNNNEQEEQEAGGEEIGQFDLFDGIEGGGNGGDGTALDDEDIYAGLEWGQNGSGDNNNNGEDDDLALAADGSIVARRRKKGEAAMVEGETYQGAPTEAESRLKRLLDELDDDLPPPEPKEKPKEKVHFTSADELRALLMEALKK